jgi:Tn3 transposase DDE domain
MSLLRRFGRPVYRSMIRRFAEAMIKALKDAHLADFRFGFPMFWRIYFPNEVSRIIGTLDRPRLAEEPDLRWYSTVFSAAERESAYVIDGLIHNEVVKSDIHSTDAFGFSELVSAVSHLLGFSYAPRFKNLQCQRLYIFRNRKRASKSRGSGVGYRRAYAA